MGVKKTVKTRKQKMSVLQRKVGKLEKKILKLLNEQRSLTRQVVHLQEQRSGLLHEIQELEGRKAAFIPLTRTTERGTQTIETRPEDEKFWREKGYKRIGEE